MDFARARPCARDGRARSRRWRGLRGVDRRTRDDRQLRGDAAAVQHDPQGREDRRERVHLRRVGHRQGADGARDSRALRPRQGPFVAINCGAIPHHLLQSELFGYERGAFTGANQRRAGRIESANGGTLFLDEIGDMPVESQASLLRFLQEGKIERLGGQESIPVDVRIISATHVDLDGAVEAGRFRADLYHRLCVLRIHEPPLRGGKDIDILAHYVLQKFKSDSGRKISGFTSAALDAMRRYEWPGNVRELINRVRRAIVMAESRLLTPHDLGNRDAGRNRTRDARTGAGARRAHRDRECAAAQRSPHQQGRGRTRHFTRDALPDDDRARAERSRQQRRERRQRRATARRPATRGISGSAERRMRDA